MQLLNPDNFKHHIDRFNTMEPEGVVNLIPNAQSWDWIKQNVPFFIIKPERPLFGSGDYTSLSAGTTKGRRYWRERRASASELSTNARVSDPMIR